MSTPNRKISFYLKPAHSRADQLADEMLDALPAKARGNASRAAMLAGMALMRQDPRLPHLIAELFDDNTTISQIRHLISSIFPDDNTAAVIALRQLCTQEPIQTRDHPSPISTPMDNSDISRQNASMLFPS